MTSGFYCDIWISIHESDPLFMEAGINYMEPFEVQVDLMGNMKMGTFPNSIFSVGRSMFDVQFLKHSVSA